MFITGPEMYSRVHLRFTQKSNGYNLHNNLMQIIRIVLKILQNTCKYVKIAWNQEALKNTGSVNKINIDAYVISGETKIR